MNRELPLMAEVKGPGEIPEYLIARCQSETDAVMLCWHLRRVKYGVREAARLLDMPASHLSNVISGKKYLPHNSVEFQRLCGNWAIRQWQDRAAGFVTLAESEDQRRIRELESKLAALQAA